MYLNHRHCDLKRKGKNMFILQIPGFETIPGMAAATPAASHWSTVPFLPSLPISKVQQNKDNVGYHKKALSYSLVYF